MGEHVQDHEIATLREIGGYARLPEMGLVIVSGPDAAKYLQAQTTNDVLALKPGDAQMSAILDRTAHIQAFFTLNRLSDEYWLVVERNQIPKILEKLDCYHFTENVTWTDSSSDFVVWSLQGPRVRALINQALGSPSDHTAGSHLGEAVKPVDLPSLSEISRVNLWGRPIALTKRSMTGELGYLLYVPRQHEQVLEQQLKRSAEALGLIELSQAALNIARVEAGIPLMGTDVGNEHLLPETALNLNAVSYTKGCYIGQEVVARIKTYGAPRKALVGLTFMEEIDRPFAIDTPAMVGNDEIGLLKSNLFSPTLGRFIAMAYVAREYREPGQTLNVQISGKPYSVKVTLLPFHRAVSEAHKARQLYDQGLSEFSLGDEKQAVQRLREALELDPLLTDAYESLGVILSRHEELDEAITLMKRLAELDPESVMAHTNLSVFYMQKGMKEAAEEEKAIALNMRMQKAARDFDQTKRKEEEERRKDEETSERMRMFREVLEIDGEDLLANYGLGSAHVDRGEYSKALPYLQKAINIKPSYTVAYLVLGRAHQGLNRPAEALEAYRQGIAVAARNGDLMPMQDMQQRVQQLESKQTPLSKS